MAMYMAPPARKKQVEDRYNPDTFRVIGYFAEESHPKYDRGPPDNISEWRKQFRQNKGLALPDIYNRNTEVLPHVAPDYRAHKPHPGNCGFLRSNVRLLNEPICSVYTEVTKDEQKNWWPSRVSNEPLQVPPKTNDTIYRADFQERDDVGGVFGSLRHTANPNKEPALGTVPVNFLHARDRKQRFYKEKLSYEHQYNSRVEPNYPIRGKRHGSFVWDQMSPDATQKFVDHYSVISAEEGAARQREFEAHLDAAIREAARNVCHVPEPPKMARPDPADMGYLEPQEMMQPEPPQMTQLEPQEASHWEPQEMVQPEPQEIQAEPGIEVAAEMEDLPPKQTSTASSVKISAKHSAASSAKPSPKHSVAGSAKCSPKHSVPSSAKPSPKHSIAGSAKHTPMHSVSSSAKHTPKHSATNTPKWSPKHSAQASRKHSGAGQKPDLVNSEGYIIINPQQPDTITETAEHMEPFINPVMEHNAEEQTDNNNYALNWENTADVEHENV